MNHPMVHNMRSRMGSPMGFREILWSKIITPHGMKIRDYFHVGDGKANGTSHGSGHVISRGKSLKTPMQVLLEPSDGIYTHTW